MQMQYLFFSPYAYMDPLSTNMTYMFSALINDALKEYAYDAEKAGIYYHFADRTYGLTVI